MHTRLPKKVVQRVRKVVTYFDQQNKSRVERAALNLRNIDQRQARGTKVETRDIKERFRLTKDEYFGGRVRLLKVKGLNQGVIVKLVHDITVSELIRILKKRVIAANNSIKKTKWKVIMPIIYPVRKDMFLMAYSEKPTIQDILKQTKRGREFIEVTSKRENLTKEELFDKIYIAINDLRRSTKTTWDHFIVKDFNKGEVIFVPRPDHE